jgi:hypothetical protein
LCYSPDFDPLARQPGLGERSDISATLLSLARYCAILAADLVAATVTLDKQRAESVLCLLTGIAALIAAELIGYDLGCLRLPGYG